ncbi:hypothetical protein FDENT_4747 [Fusarium denticulatum]|uniref:Uncharacterized protein n=1 Tax=Fusarium denticulatum TaxID=48507 RepID=A0A8H5UIS5_9HYPO|nr:hypothetical protein FDENT_4747 [Fusarium denticulatum]
MRSLHYLLSSLSVIVVTSTLASPLVIPGNEGSLAVRHSATDDFDNILPKLSTRAVKKPFYAIAHRCNDMGAVQRAVNDGANAIEMDLFSEGKDGWDLARQILEPQGPSSIQKRVASYGWMNLEEGFGDYTESGDAHLTCTQLRQEVASGKFGKVFSWTAVVDQVQFVQKLMGVGIDGIIYGLDGAPYGGSATQALAQIRSSLQKNGGYRFAGTSDNPW